MRLPVCRAEMGSHTYTHAHTYDALRYRKHVWFVTAYCFLGEGRSVYLVRGSSVGTVGSRVIFLVAFWQFYQSFLVAFFPPVRYVMNPSAFPFLEFVVDHVSGVCAALLIVSQPFLLGDAD